MRWWVKDHPVSAKRLTDGSVAQAILRQEPHLAVSFAAHPSANPASRQKGLVRWQKNPEPEWGPKPRARRCEGREISVPNTEPRVEVTKTGGKKAGARQSEEKEISVPDTELRVEDTKSGGKKAGARQSEGREISVPDTELRVEEHKTGGKRTICQVNGNFVC